MKSYEAINIIAMFVPRKEMKNSLQSTKKATMKKSIIQALLSTFVHGEGVPLQINSSCLSLLSSEVKTCL